uniref:Uncharacterized protein n=1 Tax=Bicosoecida sp. CB-2014 TaxID=1486930 RepID=A0A7S1CFH5_9STRA|mmetsp:Transcript_23192/g.80799  ORF Transcript_23192/g.80799 Transcript_23192/m.80799 type:complete len:377 (+) Transcript_23192:170-1300(+)
MAAAGSDPRATALARLAEGDGLFVEDEVARAKACYDAALAADPSIDADATLAARVYGRRAAMQLELHKFEDALDDANRAIRAAPTNFHAHYRKGTACFYMDEFETAKAAFAKATELSRGAETSLGPVLAQWIRKCEAEIAEGSSDESDEVSDDEPSEPVVEDVTPAAAAAPPAAAVEAEATGGSAGGAAPAKAPEAAPPAPAPAPAPPPPSSYPIDNAAAPAFCAGAGRNHPLVRWPSSCARTCSCHASDAHSSASVLPVPVGDSSSAFLPSCIAWITRSMYTSCGAYGFTGNSTLTPRIRSSWCGASAREAPLKRRGPPSAPSTAPPAPPAATPPPAPAPSPNSSYMLPVRSRRGARPPGSWRAGHGWRLTSRTD